MWKVDLARNPPPLVDLIHQQQQKIKFPKSTFCVCLSVCLSEVNLLPP